MPELLVTIGDQTFPVELPQANQAYRLVVTQVPGETAQLSVEPVPEREPQVTGTCPVHGEPLYDGSRHCSECWDEYDAYLCIMEDE